jgi:hypothetical protein
MKTFGYCFLSLMMLFTELRIQANEPADAEEITYDWLLTSGFAFGATDHLETIRFIFENKKVKTLLEFGLGFPTKYFLENCNKVISTEFVINGYQSSHLQKFLTFYRDSPNWLPIAYFSCNEGSTQWAPYKFLGSEHVSKAAGYQCATHQNYAQIDDFYLLEMNAFLANLVKCHKIDAAVINPPMYLRGDIVQLLFGKISLIIAHDTACRFQGEVNDVYGYCRVSTPDDYEEIYIPYGQGTTVWVEKKDSFKSLTLALQDYAEAF